MYGNAGQAYETAMKSTGSSRELEAAALFKAARQLEACQRAWESSDRPAKLKDALQYNQRLWTFFQSELGDPDHGLPVEIRVNLLRISTFVDKRTFEILAGPDAQKLQALIEINRHIAAGLTGSQP
jgi:flagellar biosynthesis activator protein FlaF